MSAEHHLDGICKDCLENSYSLKQPVFRIELNNEIIFLCGYHLRLTLVLNELLNEQKKTIDAFSLVVLDSACAKCEKACKNFESRLSPESSETDNQSDNQ